MRLEGGHNAEIGGGAVGRFGMVRDEEHGFRSGG